MKDIMGRHRIGEPITVTMEYEGVIRRIHAPRESTEMKQAVDIFLSKMKARKLGEKPVPTSESELIDKLTEELTKI